MMQSSATNAWPVLRLLSNVVALLALVFLVDWGWSSWTGRAPLTCGPALAITSSNAINTIGFLGVVAGLLGIVLGGVRHWMTALAAVVLVFGLLGLTVAGEQLANFCAR